MMKNFNKEIESFSNTIVNFDNYRKQLRSSFDNKLFDFSVILLWKILMLYVYERFQQIQNKLGAEHFEVSLKKVLKNVGKISNLSRGGNIYVFNQEDDDKIISLIGEFYSIDGNFLKKIRGLKMKRDTSAHVCNPVLCNNKDSVLSFFEEIRIILIEIQRLHESTFLIDVKIDKLMGDGVLVSDLDKKFLTKRAIDFLVDAPNFNSAEKSLRFIKSNLHLISNDMKSCIIKNSLKNLDDNNQVNGCAYSKVFFRDLHNSGGIDITEWRDFYVEITKKNSWKEPPDYLWLKKWLDRKKAQISTYISHKKKIYFSDIPF